jgi:hypothetical protein
MLSTPLSASARRAFATALLLLPLAGCAPSRPSTGAGEQRFPEHYAHSLAALGWPGARRAFQVGPGSVVGTGECALEWTLPAGGPVTCTPVAFERDGVPVAHWTMTSGDTRLDFEAAAAPVAALGDTTLIATVRVEASSRSGRACEIAFDARVRGLADGASCVPWDCPDPAAVTEWWDGRDALRDGRVVARVDARASRDGDAPSARRPAHVTGTGPGALVAHCVARLAPGERRAWEFALPVYPVPARSRAAFERAAAHADIAADSRRAWRATLARATRLATPDSLVDAAWRAALVTLVACQERDSGRWVPIGSPFQYRDVWIRDGARVVRALAVAGLADHASDDARTLARFQLPGGALISQRGQLDGTGQALWALEQASVFGRDTALAREALPVAAAALDWVRLQREASRQVKAPWVGLLPYGNPKDGELVRAQLVGNDAWAIAGLDAIAALARRGGDAELAGRAAAEATDLRATFVAALARSGAADIPPSWQGAGRDWGNAAVGWPTGALDPGDRRVTALTRRLLARAGGTGLGCYGPDDSLHTYLGVDLVEAALRAGRGAEARAWLAGLLAHSSSTLGQAEILSRRDGGFGVNLPPHSTAAAGVVSLVRDMLLCECRDTLAVALGGDASWWAGTRLERAPTHFGVTTLTLERPAPTTLRVRLEPLDAPLRVRVPDGSLATAASAGRVVDGRWVEAPPGTRELTITVTTVGGAR